MSYDEIHLSEDEMAIVQRFAEFGEEDVVAQELGLSEQDVREGIDEVLRKLQLGSLLCTLIPTSEETTEAKERELVSV